MTAIALLEKLGADASFEPSMLTAEDKQALEKIITQAKTFNALNLIHVPDEDEEENDKEEDKEKDEK